MIGYHGETKEAGRVVQPVRTPFFVAFDRDLAEISRDTGGRILLIEYDPKNALMLDTPERFIEIWKSSGAKEFCSWNRWPKLPPEGWFHPRTTRYFSEWAKQKGYDAVIIPHAAFVGEDGFREVGGVFGDPQAIILNPHIIQAITELEELEEIYG